ncbi:MAG: lytic transglycosylase domain-containing protein [Gammaproteobacteria bacterium]
MVTSKSGVKHLPKSSFWSTSLFISLIVLSMNCYGEYFVYKHEDGTTWYSDKNLPAQNYKLIATIGRPTASVSCTGSISNRAKDHAPIIQQYSDLYGVNQELIKAIITVESCFDRYAVSRVGAKGLMQLMPQTAELMGVHNVFNAKDNIRGGTRYFRQMLELFEFDVELALAAYNAGPNAVKKYDGIPPYKETQGYVKKVIKHYNSFTEVDS